MTTQVQQLAAFAARAPEDEAVRVDVVRRVRDVLGICLAARGEDSHQAIREVVLGWGGAPAATLVGEAERLPAAAAALHNGTLAHTLDFDDTHLPSVLHPSASVIAATLAAAEAGGASGATVAHAAAAGDEICIRLGMAGYDREARSSVYFDRGLHATAICGTVGAAAAVGVVLGLDADRLAHAMSIACSMGAGIIEANRTGGTVKRIHCGWAAHAGVAAAEAARAGLTGPPTVLEGRFGFLQALLGDRADLDAVTSELGGRWELLGVHFKPYPANHFTHAIIDSALELRAGGVRPSDVESVVVEAPAPVLHTIAEPPEQKAAPPTGYAAKFSGPFTFALALAGGGGLGLSLDDFEDARVRDPELLALAASVTCRSSPEVDALFPAALPAIVHARLRDGRELAARVLTNRGGPERPLSADELAVKFRINASRALDADGVARLDAELDRLLELPDVGSLMALTRATRDAAEASRAAAPPAR